MLRLFQQLLKQKLPLKQKQLSLIVKAILFLGIFSLTSSVFKLIVLFQF
jgi:hypothetical protein